MKALIESILDTVLINFFVLKTVLVLAIYPLRKISMTRLLQHLPVAILAAVLVEAIKVLFFH